MKVLKYSTKHLTCYQAKSLLGQEHYQIFENDKLIAIYVDINTMHLADDSPVPETSYKYFNELSEIITFLYELEKGE